LNLVPAREGGDSPGQSVGGQVPPLPRARGWWGYASHDSRRVVLGWFPVVARARGGCPRDLGRRRAAPLACPRGRRRQWGRCYCSCCC